MTEAAVRAPELVEPPRHRAIDDIAGLAVGALVISFGLFLLKAGGVVTGGTAGLSLLLGYVLPIPFGVIFVVVNLPFFALAARGKGWRFVARSLVSIMLVSLLTSLHASAVGPLELHPVYAAVLGNVLCGVGLLILFRHNSSLGGFTVVALVVQERFGFRAGYVLLALDLCVVLASFTVLAPVLVLVSALGAAVLSSIIMLNHRPGRYRAT
ncbi:MULTISPECIES: YitT family protein [unclassified Pseudoclavibacter]|uniref:YitT family protein n=1 Tax=unclassified Pseudoclavibacter TaxID=2615177 RepID=UPI001BA6EB85|nr:YitT family protein [Pseudoclavibacter sp. Marseille-Q4354]MBS3180556.1 YitT family protein [Pseudoclavibacter sp. Marseille-Q4354]